MQRNPSNLAVCHSIILKGELTVGEHKLWIILLGTFDSPWRIDKYDFEFANFLNEEFPIEISYIAINKRIAYDFPLHFLSLIKFL